MANKVQDPVDEKTPENTQDAAPEPEKSGATGARKPFTLDDLGVNADALAEKINNPFANYKPADVLEIKSGNPKVPNPTTSATNIVGYRGDVPQDRSNGGRRTYHSRSIRDTDGTFVAVVFDRDVEGIGPRCAIVPDPFVRAQLVFKLNKMGGIEVDKDYGLIDQEQSDRLIECFRLVRAGDLSRLKAVKAFDDA